MDGHKWFREIDGVRMFLPDMARGYPLSFLQGLSDPRQMSWNITRGHDGVAVGNFGTLNA